MTPNQYGPEDNRGWYILAATVAIVAIMLCITTCGWPAGDDRRTDYSATMQKQADTRMLFVRLDCWTDCPPCRKLEGELRSFKVTLNVTTTDQQHVAEYPTAHYVTSGGVPVQETGLPNISKRLKAGGLRFSGPSNKPTLEVRMWSGKQ